MHHLWEKFLLNGYAGYAGRDTGVDTPSIALQGLIGKLQYNIKLCSQYTNRSVTHVALACA